MSVCIGLDVHGKFCACVAQNGRGKEIGSGRVPASRERLAQMLDTKSLSENLDFV